MTEMDIKKEVNKIINLTILECKFNSMLAAAL